MDMVITRDGRWIHEGGEIRREGLVKLFASILKREGDAHYLVTPPVEKWQITVEDAPFVGVDVDVTGMGRAQEVHVTTNLATRPGLIQIIRCALATPTCLCHPAQQPRGAAGSQELLSPG